MMKIPEMLSIFLTKNTSQSLIISIIDNFIKKMYTIKEIVIKQTEQTEQKK